MASFAYNIAKFQLLNADLDFNAPDDIRVLLLEANSDVNADDADVAAVLARAGTTELTSTGYSRGALAGEATSQDDVNDRGEFDATDLVFSAISQAAAETVVAALVFKFITNDADSIPIAHIDTGGFPITPNGSDITLQWNAQGILQTT